ncbi:MAG: hypothetical protein EBX41_02275 [Chitinophagia bacterium]|nr:hypothetical protein [Chitinophagia bacterium]
MNTKSTSQIFVQLEKMFQDHFGEQPAKVEPLTLSGSDRRYFRLHGNGKTAIGTCNPNTQENNTFFYITDLFNKHQIPVPVIYTVNKDRSAYLQQDLGDTTLFHLVLKEGYTATVKKYFETAIQQLAKVQWVAGQEADFKQCHNAQRFDEKTILADLQYFKYYFADLQGIVYNRNRLAEEMQEFCRELGRVQPQTLIYRDFQSRNIMIHDNKVFFIDYQGFMQGPPQYDLASLLWQARAQMPVALKESLINTYVEALATLPIPRMDEIYLRKGYIQFVLIRLIQVLGAYGFRGLIQQKSHFRDSIAPALKNLQTHLSEHLHTPNYPEFRQLLENLSAPDIQERYNRNINKENTPFKVYIYSFSYKSGMPKIGGTHGGGYVFDCRGIVNPGKFADYKHLTGKDPQVQHFLNLETKMPYFLNHVYGLVTINVDEYIARGFEQLSVAFGCTGGQHRSVFAAESLAQYLQEKNNITVEVTHLNEKKWVLGDEPPTTA